MAVAILLLTLTASTDTWGKDAPASREVAFAQWTYQQVGLGLGFFVGALGDLMGHCALVEVSLGLQLHRLLISAGCVFAVPFGSRTVVPGEQSGIGKRIAVSGLLTLALSLAYHVPVGRQIRFFPEVSYLFTRFQIEGYHGIVRFDHTGRWGAGFEAKPTSYQWLSFRVKVLHEYHDFGTFEGRRLAGHGIMVLTNLCLTF